MTTYTWQDVGDRPDKVLTRAEKEAIAAEWNDYETNTKPALDLQSLREARNRKLAETDWMCFPDSPTMSDAWKKYRQDLRDITKTATSLDDVKWPTKP